MYVYVSHQAHNGGKKIRVADKSSHKRAHAHTHKQEVSVTQYYELVAFSGETPALDHDFATATATAIKLQSAGNHRPGGWTVGHDSGVGQAAIVPSQQSSSSFDKCLCACVCYVDMSNCI